MKKQVRYAVERRDGVTVIRPSGQLDSGQVARCETLIKERMSRGERHVVLDFSTLMFISSPALRFLLIAAKRARREQGTFLLCGLPPHITELMKTTGFDRVLQIRNTREDAIHEAATRASDSASRETSMQQA